MYQTLLFLLFTAGIPQGERPVQTSTVSINDSVGRAEVIGILRGLRNPEHAPLTELVLELRPTAGRHLALFANILTEREVPGLGEEPQILSEVQRDLILMTLEGVDSAKTARYFLRKPSGTLTKAEAVARVELLGAIGNRGQLNEIFGIARDSWLKSPKGDSEPISLGRTERNALRTAIKSIAKRDDSSFDHIIHKWASLQEEVQIQVLIALGSCKDPKAFDVLDRALDERDSLASAALSQIQKRGRHPFLSRTQDLRRAVRTFLDGPSAEVSAACKALGVLGDMRSIPQLIDLLDDESAQVQNAAYWALGQLSGRPFPASKSRWNFWYASEQKWLRSEKAESFRLLHSNDARIAGRAAESLQKHPLVFDELESSIETLLSNQRITIQLVGVQLAAARNLVWTLPILVEMFSDRDQELSAQAFQAACKISGLNAAIDSEIWDEFRG